jgi:hypothetical protein
MYVSWLNISTVEQYMRLSVGGPTQRCNWACIELAKRRGTACTNCSLVPEQSLSHLRHSLVSVALVHAIEQLHEAAPHATGDAAHHAKVVVDQTATTLGVNCNVAGVRVCTSRCECRTTAQEADKDAQ